MNIEEASSLALEQLKAGDIHRAETIYREILKEQTDNITALHFLGVIYYQQKKYDLAIQFIKTALQIEPAYTDAWNNLGIIYRDLGQFDEAIACYQKALSFNPNFVQAYINLGNTFQAMNRLDEAIISYKKATELRPDISGIYLNLGLIYQKKGQFEEAVKCCMKELLINPAETKINYILGTVFLAMGEVDRSLAYYRNFLHMKPDIPFEYSNAEIILNEKKHLTEAVADYKKNPDLSILLAVPVFNRKKITQLSLEQLKRYKTGYCRLQAYNDHSTEYSNDFLKPYTDEVIQLPGKMGIHNLRMYQFKNFLETDFDLLYMTDNDIFHDPHYITVLKVLYETGNRKLPVCLFNSKVHMADKNILFRKNGIILKRFTSGASMLYDRTMVEKIVSMNDNATADHHMLAWDYRVMVYLGLPWLTSETSYAEHFGGGGIHHNDYETDRALNPTQYLHEKREAILKYLTQNGELQITF